MKKLTKILRKETRKVFQIFSQPTFIYLTVVGNAILVLTTAVVYQIEKDAANSQMKSYFDSLWWGISTITTVAYGDILPQTLLGRWIGIGLMYTGTVLFISFTGILLSNLLKDEVGEEIAPLKKEMLLEEKSQEKMEALLKEILNRLERLEKKQERKIK